MAYTFTTEQRNTALDFQLRKAKALAEYRAISYVDPDNLQKLDKKISDRKDELKAEIATITGDHSKMTRAQYQEAMDARHAELKTIKEQIATLTAANNVLIDVAKAAHKKTLKSAREAYLTVWDEEKAYFGFNLGVQEIGVDAES